MKITRKHIEISVAPIQADQFFYATVKKGYGTSARINCPKELEGKKVLVVILDNPGEQEKGAVKLT